MKDVEICSCGRCSTFADRGTKFACDMILDGECAQAIMATAVSMVQVAHSVLVPVALQQMGMDRDDPVAVAIARELATRAMNDVSLKINAFFEANSNKFVDAVNEIIDKRNKRVEQESNLPKGD